MGHELASLTSEPADARDDGSHEGSNVALTPLSEGAHYVHAFSPFDPARTDRHTTPDARDRHGRR